MLRNNFDFSLVVNSGSVKEYEHQGQVFVEGKKGTEFSIRLKNNTHKRCLAVITVDGKSVIDGAPGNLDENGGYIVDAYSSVTVPGWRLNNDAVAKFIFSDPGESYVAQSDDNADAMNNIGVIGCAVFYEQQLTTWNNWGWEQNQSIRDCPVVPLGIPTIWYGTQSAGTSAVNPKSDNTAPNISAAYNYNMGNVTTSSVCNLGTGFGSATNHSVSERGFQRCTEPETVFTLYYDTRIGLEARGVNLKACAYICPSPFPASKGRGCKPPLNWDGSHLKLNPNAKLEINPEIEEIKKKKATDEMKKMLKKQYGELKNLKAQLEKTSIKIDLDDEEAVAMIKLLQQQ